MSSPINYKAAIYNSIASSENMNGIILNVKSVCNTILTDKTGNPFKKCMITEDIIHNLFLCSETLEEFINEIYLIIQHDEINFNSELKLISLNDNVTFKNFKDKYECSKR